MPLGCTATGRSRYVKFDGVGVEIGSYVYNGLSACNLFTCGEKAIMSMTDDPASPAWSGCGSGDWSGTPSVLRFPSAAGFSKRMVRPDGQDRLINAGVSIEAVRRRLGQAQTTQLYAELDDKVADAGIRNARRRREAQRR